MSTLGRLFTTRGKQMQQEHGTRKAARYLRSIGIPLGETLHILLNAKERK